MWHEGPQQKQNNKDLIRAVRILFLNAFYWGSAVRGASLRRRTPVIDRPEAVVLLTLPSVRLPGRDYQQLRAAVREARARSSSAGRV
jgi:hypothetical protein